MNSVRSSLSSTAVIANATLCTLPWLNPFSFGPISSVTPWLTSTIAAALAVLLSAPLAQRQHPVTGPWWCLGGASSLLILALWPRAASLPPYEALALAGGFGLIGLGALLARRLPAASDVAGLPWAWWCALLPWILAGLASSGMALLQYFGQTAPLSPWVNLAPVGEAFANLRQRNQFASLTNMALAALLALGWLGPRRWTRGQGLALLLAMGLLVTGNAASASRTGLLQLLVLSAAALLWRRDARLLAVLASLLGVYAVATVGLPWAAGLDPERHGVFARLSAGDALCSSRLTLWRNVLQLVAARPWLGWGWGELDYAHYTTLYDGTRFCDILDNAHNLPLHLAVELGIPAALLVCGGVLVWVLRARPWREIDPLRRAAWLVVAVLGTHSLLEYPLWYGPFQLALGLCLGLLWRERLALPAWPVARHGATLLAGLALAAAVYAAWDYRRISQIYLQPEQRDAAYRDGTLAKLQHSWLFRRQVLFAQLSITELTADNAFAVHVLATDLLHFSPEARIIEPLLDSARQLGLQAEVAYHAARFEAAFPEAYARWVAK